MRCAAVYLLSAVLLMSVGQGFADHAAAQSVPPGQSCGGLLCDVGIFGHKVPTDPIAAAPKAAAAPVATTAAAEPVAIDVNDEPNVHKAPVSKKRRIIKVPVAPIGSARMAPSTTVAKKIGAAAPVTAAAAPVSDTPAPASDWVIGGGTAGPRPADMFQPIYR